ncbi:hypothetical protein [Vibrio sp. HN007]|uniref:hypothetical protein n=1 Tax=Vibrio iocasae TaxID=3098914 RepID=UPI0035D44925
MKRILPLILATSFSVNASVWDDIKNTPATQLDVGRIYLDMFSTMYKEQFVGQKVGDTKYKVKSLDSFGSDGKLGLKVGYEARGKYINPQECGMFVNISKQALPAGKLAEGIYPQMKPENKEEFASTFLYEVQLINTDNGAVMAECRSDKL